MRRKGQTVFFYGCLVRRLIFLLMLEEDDEPEWNALQFMNGYMAEVVAESVVDKRVDLELLLGFPAAFLQKLYKIANRENPAAVPTAL